VSHALPDARDFLKAVEIYLKHAYHGAPPSAVRLRVETLRAMPRDEFYQSAVLEKDSQRNPSKIFLRLGNQSYPHMKLALFRQLGAAWAFAVEEHDQVGVPTPGSREYRFFSQMIAHNRELAIEIEQALQEAGLPVQPRLPIKGLDREVELG
jgi:hypothetical protein